MSSFVRPRRPLARLAAGAAAVGVTHHSRPGVEGRTPDEEEMFEAYNAFLVASPPQYVPSLSQSARGVVQMQALMELHEAGILSDAVFESAKAKLLGL